MKAAESRKTGLSVTQNMVVTTVIILFFLGIVLLYYIRLNAETRDNIIKSGELNAVNAAVQIDAYLATGVDSTTLTGYTLDNMLRDGRSQEEILEFLIDQSFAMENVVKGQVNGIYGYINGEYLDGALWVPDSSFVPTERPWYVDAMAHAGKVVVVDPYVDAQTGDIMITMAKTLGDGKSVVAIDVSTEPLQVTVEEIAAQGSSDMEVILNHAYQVIAHSDPEEVGKDYLQRDGSFGSAIVEQLRRQSSSRSHFSVKYGGAEYIVYAITIENDWVCLSVKNATTAFQRLRIPLILTIVVSCLIIAVCVGAMIRSNRKDALARQMQQLAEQQTVYAYRDQLTGLKNRRAYTEEIERLSAALPEDCCVAIFDVNGLKAVNDTYGHKAGDALIIAAADCIRAAFAGADRLYRLGGDEFCVIMTGTEEEAQRCLTELDRRAAAWERGAIHGFAISCGLVATAGYPDIDAVLKDADRRMYENKSRYYQAAEHDRRRE